MPDWVLTLVWRPKGLRRASLGRLGACSGQIMRETLQDNCLYGLLHFSVLSLKDPQQWTAVTMTWLVEIWSTTYCMYNLWQWHALYLTDCMYNFWRAHMLSPGQLVHIFWHAHLLSPRHISGVGKGGPGGHGPQWKRWGGGQSMFCPPPIKVVGQL